MSEWREGQNVPPWKRHDWIGSGSGDVAEAVEFARECAADWQTRVVVRFGGKRTVKGDGTPDPNGRPLWNIYRRDIPPGEDES